MYLNIQDGNTSLRYTLTDSCNKPYLKVSNESVLPLTTNTSQGLQLKVQIDGQIYRGAVYSSASKSASYLTSSGQKGDMSSTTALTSSKTTSTSNYTATRTISSAPLTQKSTTNTSNYTATRTKSSKPLTAYTTTGATGYTATRTKSSKPLTAYTTTGTTGYTATRTKSSKPLTNTVAAENQIVIINTNASLSKTIRGFYSLISIPTSGNQGGTWITGIQFPGAMIISYTDSVTNSKKTVSGTTYRLDISGTYVYPAFTYANTSKIYSATSPEYGCMVGYLKSKLSTAYTYYHNGVNISVTVVNSYTQTQTTNTAYTTEKYTSRTAPLTQVTTTNTAYTTEKYTSRTAPLTQVTTTGTAYTTEKYTSRTEPLTQVTTTGTAYTTEQYTSRTEALTSADTYGYTGVSSSSSSIETWM